MPPVGIKLTALNSGCTGLRTTAGPHSAGSSSKSRRIYLPARDRNPVAIHRAEFLGFVEPLIAEHPPPLGHELTERPETDRKRWVRPDCRGYCIRREPQPRQ